MPVDVGSANDAAEDADVGTAVETEIGGRLGGTIEHDRRRRLVQQGHERDQLVTLSVRSDFGLVGYGHRVDQQLILAAPRRARLALSAFT